MIEITPSPPRGQAILRTSVRHNAAPLDPQSSFSVDQVPARLRPRLLPLHPAEKRPYRVREGGFTWAGMPGVTEDVIEDWLRRYPNCEWGLRTGVVEGVDQGLCLVVADIDQPQLVPRTWTRYVLRTAGMPAVNTRRGFHVYGYSVRPRASSPSTWGDWKGHPNALVKLHTTQGLPVGAPMLWPQEVMDSLKQVDASPSPPPKQRTTRRRSPGQMPFTVADYGPSQGKQAWNVKVPILHDGKRHTGLRKALDRLIGRTPELKDNFALICKWLAQVNEEKCVPPLPDVDIREMALNAATRSRAWTGHTMGFMAKQGGRGKKGGKKSGKARREATRERDKDIRVMRASSASYKEIEARHGLERTQIYRILNQPRMRHERR